MASKIVQLKDSAGNELNPIPALASSTRAGGALCRKRKPQL